MQRIHWINDVQHYVLKMYTVFYELLDIFPYPARKEVSI